MRSAAAEWAPGFGDRDHFLRTRARRECEAALDGSLQCDIARGPRVAVAQAEEQVDICRPRSDAGQGSQDVVCFVRIDVTQRLEVEAFRLDFFGEVEQRLRLGT